MTGSVLTSDFRCSEGLFRALLTPRAAMIQISGIHPTVLMGSNVTLGENVSIGPGSIIHDNVEIGANSIIGANVILGEPLPSYYADPDHYVNPRVVIGKKSLIRSGCVVYAGCEFGEEFATGHGAVIRERTKVGHHSRVGTHSDIQGECEIGNYVRIHSAVITSQNVRIHDFVWILPHCVLADCPHPPSEELFPPTVEEYAVIAANSVILPGVNVGAHSLVGASSVVKHNVAQGAVVVGQPAKQVAWAKDIRSRVTGQAMYPWRRHFSRGMPWDVEGFIAPDGEIPVD